MGLILLALGLLGMCYPAGAVLRRQFDFREGGRANAQWTQNRRLQAGPDNAITAPMVDVCYEGCFTAPLSNPWAMPLPQILARGPYGKPMPLLNCSSLAWAAGLEYFAIVDEIDCYGGNTSVTGWAPANGCGLACVPGGDLWGSCGGNRQASVFSMGECVSDDSPCESGPSKPMLPPSPPSQPSPPASPPPRLPPPPVPSSFRCRDGGVSLWGTELPRMKLNLKNNLTTNTALCHRLCGSNPECRGFYFKTDNYCHQFSRVYSFTGKRYRSVVRSCRLMVSASG